MKGILGRKAGMTQVFTKDGKLIPVTVIDVSNNVVTQVKNKETNGYDSIQLSTGEQKAHRVPKAKRGHFEKAKTTPKRFTKEIRNMSGFELGATVKAGDLFTTGELVDVTGISKGKGFAGVIKRHNQSRGPMSHGSQFHRQMGSMGDIEGNKISKGKKMAGQMGNVQRTTQNLTVIDINDAEGYILVKGPIPGPNKSYVVVKTAIKGLDAKVAPELIDYQAEAKAKAQAEVEAKAAEAAAKAQAEADAKAAEEAAKAEANAAVEEKTEDNTPNSQEEVQSEEKVEEVKEG